MANNGNGNGNGPSEGSDPNRLSVPEIRVNKNGSPGSTHGSDGRVGATIKRLGMAGAIIASFGVSGSVGHHLGEQKSTVAPAEGSGVTPQIDEFIKKPNEQIAFAAQRMSRVYGELGRASEEVGINFPDNLQNSDQAENNGHSQVVEKTRQNESNLEELDFVFKQVELNLDIPGSNERTPYEGSDLSGLGDSSDPKVASGNFAEMLERQDAQVASLGERLVKIAMALEEQGSKVDPGQVRKDVEDGIPNPEEFSQWTNAIREAGAQVEAEQTTATAAEPHKFDATQEVEGVANPSNTSRQPAALTTMDAPVRPGQDAEAGNGRTEPARSGGPTGDQSPRRGAVA